MPDHFRKLNLTTPPMSGPDVTEAQTQLHTSRFGDFHPGKVDGTYGNHTAAAVRRAKYWTGVRKRTIRGRHKNTYGPRLHAVLSGERKLTVAQRVRRARRLWQLERETKLSKMVKIAAGQVGTKESPPDSNRVIYSSWYGIVGPWCAMFVSWCAMKAGIRFHYAFVPFVVADARAGRNGLTTVTLEGARAGDLVCFDWERDGTADHIGILVSKSGSTIHTIEGNTSLGNDSNGGEVMRRERDVSLVQAFVRITKL